MFQRGIYLKQLKKFRDKPFIKVLSGLRRSGKSTLLKLLMEDLKAAGIPENQIIHVNFESFEFSQLNTSRKFYNFIKKKITSQHTYYILIDEIQELPEWEKAVNAIMVDFKSDLYITGSNSRLLSSELSTYLTGRFVEILVYPLSFREYLTFHGIEGAPKEKIRLEEFQNYLRLGGFPALSIASYDTESAYQVINDIYSSAILRDTVQRHNIRDVELLDRIVKFAFENLGSSFSAKRVADYFKSQYRKVDLNTIYNYLYALESAYILYKVPRYNVKGREVLKTQEKYFPGDHSLLFGVMGYKDRMISGILENMVFLELMRRGYKVYVGKWNNLEIDFVAEKGVNRIYVQVAYKLHLETTIDREFSALMAIRDHYPKYVISMDEFFKDNLNGINHLHISSFLLTENL